MRRIRRTLAAALTALVATVGFAIVAAPPASAAPLPIDPNMLPHWARWTFHTGGNFDLVMDAANSGGSGSRVILYPSTRNSNQLWFQEEAVEGGQYLHPGYDRNLCLGRANSADGTKVAVQGCSGSVNQRWAIPRYFETGYQLRAQDNQNACVDVPQSNFSQSTQLQMWGCNGTAAQLWNTGRCFAGGCDGYWPDIMDCDIGGGDVVRDVSQGGNRIVLVRATGCHAFYARLTSSSGNTSSINLVLWRYYPDRPYQYYSIPLSPGQTRWSQLLGVNDPDATFEACAEKPGQPDFRFCSGIWWA